MDAGRHFGLEETAGSTQVASFAIAGSGLVACPVVAPAFFGFGPGNFLAIYRMAYELALAEVAARPTFYDVLQQPCWN